MDISLAKRVGLLLAQLIEQDFKQFGEEDRIAAGHQVANRQDGTLSHGQTLALELRDEEREYLGVRADEVRAKVVQNVGEDIECFQLNRRVFLDTPSIRLESKPKIPF